MIHYPSREQILQLHARLLASSGGSSGIRDAGLIESALAQPQQTFGGEDLYPTLPEKAAALACSLLRNHPFVDGNKRVGYAAGRLLLLLNGWDLVASLDEREHVFLSLAAGTLGQEAFREWFIGHSFPQ